jgi:hypothetical protein
MGDTIKVGVSSTRMIIPTQKVVVYQIEGGEKA